MVYPAGEDDGGQGNAIVDTGAGDSEVKVRGTLLRHIEAWEAAGAGAFALGVIKEGFRLSMLSMPRAYEEGNNKSFEKDREFAVEAVQKLVRLEILKEVGRSEVTCVNLLTDRKSTRLNSSHITISYAVFCLKKIFFNDTATTEIYTLSLHDALPIWRSRSWSGWRF